jgi:hypothetical protein
VLFKGALTGPSPVDRARTGSKHHLLTDGSGIPLALSLTGGHRNDVTQLLPLIDGLGPVRLSQVPRGCDQRSSRRRTWRPRYPAHQLSLVLFAHILSAR